MVESAKPDFDEEDKVRREAIPMLKNLEIDFMVRSDSAIGTQT